MDMDNLSRTARSSLPYMLREQWFNARGEIRAELREKRKSRYVAWDDPEYVALCAIKLAEFLDRAQQHVNRLSGDTES